MSRWESNFRHNAGQMRQMLSLTPVFSGNKRDLQSCYYQINEYAYGINVTLGDMFQEAFKDWKAAKTKYGYDRDRLKRAEEMEEPREAHEPDTPDVSDEEEQPQSRSRSSPKGPLEAKIEKPKNWSTMKEEEKKEWEEKARRRKRRAMTRTAKDVYFLRKKRYRDEQQYLQRCRMFQLLVTQAFSAPKVVQFLRSKKFFCPFEKVGKVKEKYGNLSGAARYVEEKEFRERRPRPTEDMEEWLTQHMLQKNWLETLRGKEFEPEEAVNGLLEKLEAHEAFGENYLNDHYRLAAASRPTHDDMVESAKEMYILWVAKQKRQRKNRRGRDGKGEGGGANLLLKEGDGGDRGKNKRRDRGKKGDRSWKGKGDIHRGSENSGQEWWLTAVCYNCNETGHTKRFCPKSKSNPKRSGQKPNYSDTSKGGNRDKNGKFRKKGDRGVTLIRGEVGEEAEEGETHQSEGENSSEEEEYELIIMETGEEGVEGNQNTGGEDDTAHEEQEGEEDSEPQREQRDNELFEQPTRARGEGNLSSAPMARVTLRDRPHNSPPSILTGAQRPNTSTTTLPTLATSPPRETKHVQPPPPPQSSQPAKPKPKLRPNSFPQNSKSTQHESPPTSISTPKSHTTGPHTIRCEGTNFRGEQCGVKLGQKGSWGKSGNEAKRLSYASLCGYHAWQDPNFPSIDLEQPPSSRPRPSKDYPSEREMKAMMRERERK